MVVIYFVGVWVMRKCMFLVILFLLVFILVVLYVVLISFLGGFIVKLLVNMFVENFFIDVIDGGFVDILEVYNVEWENL